ncbi:MAG: carbonic anhydrase [Verrucomicrobia bacterium]|jgi:carbonic anhydrase|nr:carbonic anhydrase [Verrucomicrobiota bacterium]
MHRLIQGVHQFQTHEFRSYSSLFRRLAREGQNPHTLFITCADSRVLAELITGSRPGDLFVVKNVGNIVPPASVAGPNSTAAAVEFAIDSLGVSDIVLCGHTQCGAVSALVGGIPHADHQPHLAEWLEQLRTVYDAVVRNYPDLVDPSDLETVMAEENVLFGLENLKTYGAVRRALDGQRVRLHGWMFKIRTAKLFAYNPESGQFEPIAPPED